MSSLAGVNARLAARSWIGFRLDSVREAKPLKGFEAFQESGDQNVLGVIDADLGLHSFLKERVCFVE